MLSLLRSTFLLSKWSIKYTHGFKIINYNSPLSCYGNVSSLMHPVFLHALWINFPQSSTIVEIGLLKIGIKYYRIFMGPTWENIYRLDESPWPCEDLGRETPPPLGGPAPNYGHLILRAIRGGSDEMCRIIFRIPFFVTVHRIKWIQNLCIFPLFHTLLSLESFCCLIMPKGKNKSVKIILFKMTSKVLKSKDYSCWHLM